MQSQLWRDLEKIYLDLTESRLEIAANLDNAGVIVFRLELLLILDRCDSSRWRSLLRAADCSALKKTFGSLLTTLDAPPSSIDGELIGSAQNQLFDAVTGHIAAAEVSTVDRRRQSSGTLHFAIEAFAHA